MNAFASTTAAGGHVQPEKVFKLKCGASNRVQAE